MLTFCLRNLQIWSQLLVAYRKAIRQEASPLPGLSDTAPLSNPFFTLFSHLIIVSTLSTLAIAAVSLRSASCVIHMIIVAALATIPTPKSLQERAEQMIAVLLCTFSCSRDKKEEGVKLIKISMNELDMLDTKTLRRLAYAFIVHRQGRHRRCKPSCRPRFINKVLNLHNLLDNIPKLTTKNWHTWKDQFLRAVRSWRNASVILEGMFRPASRHFDRVLDRQPCCPFARLPRKHGPTSHLMDDAAPQ